MRTASLTVCGIAVAVATLAACGTTTTAGAAKPAVTTVGDLAHLVSSRTSTAHTAHVTVDTKTSGIDVTGTGQLDLDGTASKLALTMSMPEISNLDMILTGGTMYMKIPQNLVKTAKPWVRFDSAGTDPVSKSLAAMTSQEQQSVDPTKMLSQIAPYGTITKSAKVTVDGQPATRYTISVDTAKLMASKTITPQTRQLLDSSGAKLPAHVDYDLSLNSANLPVRLSFSEKVTIKGKSTQIATTMTYSDWGQPVSIQVPAADQVGPLPSN
jgi:hypothetical protein